MPEHPERYDIDNADVLFEDTWGDADELRCYRCNAPVVPGSRRCAKCGAAMADCSRSCASCGLPKCIGGNR